MGRNWKWNKTLGAPDPACGYKWAWSTINLTAGNTNSCHRTAASDITADNFDDFHNTKDKLEARTKMLKGDWPGHGCEYCKFIELAGGISDRKEFNTSESHMQYISKELTDRPDKAAIPIHVTPTILEVYFTNLCNLGCIYCNPVYSSVLEAEHKRDPKLFDLHTTPIVPDTHSTTNTYENRLAAFWKWFDKNVHTLKRYHILGGEPFFQKEFIQNLEFFEQRELPELEVLVFSNLKVPEAKFKNLLERLQNLKIQKKLKSVKVVCSLDCWGPQQEYIRTGLDMDAWERNFNILLNDYKDIRLEIHGTLTGLAIKTMPDLLERVREWNKVRKVHIGYNLCVSPDNMAPTIFAPEFFDDDFEKMYEFTEHNAELTDIIKGYQKFLNGSGRDKNNIKNLIEQLQRWDKLRGTDYTVLFPWLVELRDQLPLGITNE